MEYAFLIFAVALGGIIYCVNQNRKDIELIHKRLNLQTKRLDIHKEWLESRPDSMIYIPSPPHSRRPEFTPDDEDPQA